MEKDQGQPQTKGCPEPKFDRKSQPTKTFVDELLEPTPKRDCFRLLMVEPSMNDDDPIMYHGP